MSERIHQPSTSLRIDRRVSLPTLLIWLALALPASIPAATPAKAAKSIGQRREDVLVWTEAERATRFAEMSRLFPSDGIAHGSHVHRLPPGEPLEPRWDDATTLDGYMHELHVVGLMVLQHGHVRVERYAAGFGPKKRWTSFSVAKSFTSMLLGVALRDGDVHGLDDPLARYIPELRDSAYAEVTVRQLLTMTSGVAWNEDYTDPKSDVARMYSSPCVGHQPHVLPYLAKLGRAWPAGTHWNYNTAETDLLGLLVERATGRSLAANLERAIWKPYGMADDADWLQDDCQGGDTGGSGLSATLADYARLGQLMLDGARIDGRRVVADAWLDGALRAQEEIGAPGRGYGYQWWTWDDGSYAALGIFGQMVHVDPKRGLVIVQLADWPQAIGNELVAARAELVAAVDQAVDREHGQGATTKSRP